VTTVTVAPADAVDVSLVPSGAEATLTVPAGVTDAITVIPAQRRSPVIPRRVSSVRHRLVALAIPRLPLLAVLLAVTVMSYRLLMSNTAFLDEATYMSAGHVEWQHLMHGGPPVRYSTYFSGSPAIYPLLVAAANALGGLALARLMSLACMLGAITLLYATANRLFDRRTAGWAVAVFATVEGTQFLAAFATYDAMSLMLMAFAVWISVRFAQSDRALPHAGILIGAPVLALANASKYATALFDPVVIAVVGLVVAGCYGRRQGARVAAMYGAVLAAMLCATVAVAGHSYEVGISSTTLNRAPGIDAIGRVLRDSVDWVGVIAALGLVAAVLAWRTARTSRTSSPAAWATFGLVVVLSLAVVLAPVEQARIHTVISLNKHVTFGAWFAAIAVGGLLARISGRRITALWRWVPVAALVAGLAVAGHAQAKQSYDDWPNSTQLTASLAPYVDATAGKPVLMDDSDVAQYYLGSDFAPSHWVSTYFMRYQPPGSTSMLVGRPAFVSAIHNSYFGVIALNFGIEAPVDRVIQKAVESNPHYEYIGKVQVHDGYGTGAYVLWVDRSVVAPR
jgi:hypothetical protein